MLSKEELQRITESIQLAESHTSGEIRVCIARQCNGNPLEAALKKFHQLKINKTRLHNGVLIYVSPSNHKAAIIGDEGIHDMVNSGFWNEAMEKMLTYFKNGEITEGICKGVGKVGELIKSRYPVSDNDINELGDEVILEE
ncbi:TPM domain-containing protein [Proteiniphilum sp. UBA5384]|uniref:TPM domain-containing protein n=1 Tax=Proteiniphilum sp. UBA5384 TaxID=1947279 RepID=UPI0025D7B019|nr:TPM domain-containing protein [Proteiniphilum sp. UBA5384]